jgi:hypothetical protein
VYVILPVILPLVIIILYVLQPPGQLNGGCDGDGVGVTPPNVGVIVLVGVLVGVMVLVGVIVRVIVGVIVLVGVLVGVMVLVGVGVGEGHGYSDKHSTQPPVYGPPFIEYNGRTGL